MSAEQNPARPRPDRVTTLADPPRNLVVLEGEVSKPPDFRTLPSGTALAILTLRVRADAGPARSLAVTVWEPTAATLAVEPGVGVLVVGHVVRRFWGGADGRAMRTELVADTVVPSADRRKRRRALERVARDVAG
jgi:single-stranded DNA-binding protein